MAFIAPNTYISTASNRPEWNPDNRSVIHANARDGILRRVGSDRTPFQPLRESSRAFLFYAMPNHPTHLAMYGGTVLKRAWCESCEGYTFVINARLHCCRRPFLEEADRIKRMAAPSESRHLSASVKRRILKEQDYRCAYCWKAFGSIVHRNGEPIKLRTHFDHMVPFDYVMETKEDNIVAACHVCNLSKSDFIFQSMDECRLHLLDVRAEKGYDF